MDKHCILGWLSAAAVAASFVFATPAFATVQTINLNQVFTGYTPDGSAPWLTATFTYAGNSDSGTLVLTSNLSASDFLQGGSGNGVMGWGFFLSGSNSLSNWQCTLGTCANKVYQSVNSGPVGDSFNLGFGWTSQNRFDAGQSAAYTLTFANLLTTSPFVANGDDWLSYAHVMGLANGGCSGFVVSGTGTAQAGSGMCGGGTPNEPGTPVPEPSYLGMFGLGALLLGAFLVLRRRYA